MAEAMLSRRALREARRAQEQAALVTAAEAPQCRADQPMDIPASATARASAAWARSGSTNPGSASTEPSDRPGAGLAAAVVAARLAGPAGPASPEPWVRESLAPAPSVSPSDAPTNDGATAAGWARPRSAAPATERTTATAQPAPTAAEAPVEPATPEAPAIPSHTLLPTPSGPSGGAEEPNRAPDRTPSSLPSGAERVTSAERVLAALRDLAGFGSRSGRRNWVRTVQVVVAAAAVVTLLVGIRALFWPAGGGSVPYSATFPQALAAATAERYTQAYFTWDEEYPEIRRDALAGVMQRGIDEQAGWDGTGRSDSGSATATGFTLVDAANALVTVVATVTPYSGGPGDWKAGTTKELALTVPVTVVGSRTWVSGLPASVGVPKPPAVADQAKLTVDSATTTATSATVAQYFASISRADVTLSKQGGNVSTGLGGDLSYRSLLSWKVEQSDEAHKTGFATVRWATADGTRLEQAYRVVVSDDGEPWRVRSVTAAYPQNPTN